MIIGAPERVEAYGTRTKGYQLIWHDSAGKLQSIPKLLAKFRQQRVNVKVSNGGWEPLIDREVFVYEGWGHWLFPTDGAVLRDRETWLDEEIKKLIPAGSEMQIEVTVVPNNCLTIHGHVQFRSEGVMVRVYGQTLWTSLRKLLTPFPAGMYVREREFLDAERMRPLETNILISQSEQF